MKEFVDYLNTLHRMNGNNSNATAESNYNEKNKKYAESILVEDEELVNEIKEALKIDHKVLLTGFAGDGKTTIANMIAGSSLSKTRTEINNSDFDRPLIIIKDLSEVGLQENFLYDDLINPNKNLLIVSNTGTIKNRLLSLYDKNNNITFGCGSKSSFESSILKGIECDENTYSGAIKTEEGAVIIRTFNLVKRDNLDLANHIFKKILDHPDWEIGTAQEKESIPYINRQLLIANDYLGLRRMMYIYRRVYEYGNRMTIRNLIEHFCFSLTGNHSTSNIFYFRNNVDELFFVNFFSRKAAKAGMTGAIIVDEGKYGYNIDANWKRRIWIGTKSDEYIISFSDDRVRDLYTRYQADTKYIRSNHTGRLNVLRMLFFLNNISEDDSSKFWTFCNSFLNSPCFSYFIKIQKNGKIDYIDRLLISSKLRQVVKEYFIGMKIPESSSTHSNNEMVYIAMARNSNKIKQTAQIVLKQFAWKSSPNPLNVYKDHRDIFQFCLSFPEYGISRKELPLPFIDYLLSCHLGVVSDPAFATYRKRLDNLKDEILKNSKSEEDEEGSSMVIAYMDRKKDLRITKFIKQDDIIYYEDVE